MARRLKFKRRTTIYLGRLYLHKDLDYYSKQKEPANFISERLTSLIKKNEITKYITHPDFEWKFGGVIEGDGFIYGKLGKIKKSKIRTVYDDNKEDFIELEDMVGDAEVSHFCIFFKEHIILFERRPNLGHKELIYIFSEYYNKLFDHKGGMDIGLLQNKAEIIKILKQAEKLTLVKFNLIPSNPDNSDDLKKMDEALKEINADKAKFEVENKEDGLEFKKPNLLTSSFALCDRGYGSYVLTYKKGDQELKIESRSKIIKESLDLPSETENILKEFRRILAQAKAILDENE